MKQTKDIDLSIPFLAAIIFIIFFLSSCSTAYHPKNGCSSWYSWKGNGTMKFNK